MHFCVSKTVLTTVGTACVWGHSEEITSAVKFSILVAQSCCIHSRKTWLLCELQLCSACWDGFRSLLLVSHTAVPLPGEGAGCLCVPQSLAGVLQQSCQPCLLHLCQFHPEEMLQDSESPVGCNRMEADGELRRISGEDYIFLLLSFWFHCYCLMNCVKFDPSDWKAAPQCAPKCTDKVNGCCQCTVLET